MEERSQDQQRLPARVILILTMRRRSLMGSHFSVWGFFFFGSASFLTPLLLRSSRWIKALRVLTYFYQGSGPHAASLYGGTLKAGDDGALTSPTDARLFLIPVQMGGWGGG